MTLEEILQLADIAQRIEYLKKGRKTAQPNAEALMKDWNPNLHEIMIDKEKYPKIKVKKSNEKKYTDPSTGKVYVEPAEYEEVEPNRIALPIEQDIVNLHTAFTVGTEPTLKCDSPNDSEDNLLKVLKMVFRRNKLKYQNKKIVRSWLSEQEVAEYWYVVEDDGFWAKMKRIIFGLFGKSKPQYRLKSTLWSPFRGDKLYPFFDDKGDMIALTREYHKRELDDTEVLCYMVITKDTVYNYEFRGGTWSEKSFKHGFVKMPILYAFRDEAYCDKIRPLRIRLEKLLSNYADCIDYHFFPILMLFGQVNSLGGNKLKNRVMQLMGNGADAKYLTWNQVPETVKFEMETIISQIYAMTHTPRISFDNLKGTGNALSGVAFDYVFLSTHLEVENHAESIGEFFQRRVNFLVSALGIINPSLQDAADSIDIDVDIVPYRLDNVDDKVNTASKAVSGGIWSRREGIIFAGNADRLEDELKEINEDLSGKDR